MDSPGAPLLYGITDSGFMAGETLCAKVEAALKGGCGWLQYRDKTTDKVRRKQEAQALLALCRRYGARLLINDDVELAATIGADGVHLGQTDVALERARSQLGPNAIIGITCHDSLALAQHAQRGGATYVAFGRFFSSGTKPDAPVAPLMVLARAKRQLHVPLVAIGGINPDNAAQLIAAGASTLAVCASLFDCVDPEVQARRFATAARDARPNES